MIDGNRVLAVIPARGGSKGIPRKNLVDLGGMPLIGWTIEAARESHFIDRFILSSEDAEIIDVARKLGCEVPFVRPTALAADEESGVSTVAHAVSVIEDFDYVVLLQPTSPLRSAADIDSCISLCVEQNANSCVTFAPLTKPLEWLFRMDDGIHPTPVFEVDSLGRRQDWKTAYHPNGAVYVAKVPWLREQGSFYGSGMCAFVMPPERSLDVDTPYDLELARHIIAARGRDSASD